MYQKVVKENFNRSIAVHQQGNYAEIYRFRLSEISDEVVSVQGISATLTITLMYFLMGLYAGRLKILQNPGGHTTTIRKAAFWAVFIGMPAGILYVLVQLRLRNSAFFQGLAEFVFAEFGPMLFLAYVGGILILLQRDAWKKRLSLLAPVGRMALTNYLTQSLICTTLFNGYGFGLYGKVGAMAGLSLSVAIFSIQVLWSAWWLRRFQFGPLEWIWRSLTYAKAPRFKTNSGEAPTEYCRPDL